MKVHHEAINLLLENAYQGGCKHVVIKNLSFCCLETGIYTQLDKKLRMMSEIGENLVNTITHKNQDWEWLTEFVDSVWAWILSWLGWKKVIIILVLGIVVLLIVCCGWPIMCAYIRRVFRRLRWEQDNIRYQRLMAGPDELYLSRIVETTM